jgi:serine/threonine protein kinase
MIIANKYKILEQIGIGTYGKVFKGTNIRTNEEVAIKIEKNSEFNMLKNEARIYQFLGEKDGIPQLKWFGKLDDYTYMVLSLLKYSLLDLKNNISIELPQKILSIKNTLLIGIQMIKRVQLLHEYGFLHRDIKPENFLFDNNNILNLIDFGLCKKFIDSNDEHIKMKITNNYIGTYNYMSVNAHNNLEISRRDDLESCAYILLFLLNELEWVNDNYNIDIDTIKNIKINIINNENIQHNIKNMIVYCRELHFDEKPDYVFIIQLLQE